MKYQTVILICLITLLSGCNAYHLSEESINTEIEQHLKNQPTQRVFIRIGEDKPLASLNMLITRVNVDFTEKRGGAANIHLNTRVDGTLQVFGSQLELSTHMMVSIESGLSIEEGSIYLVRPKIKNIQINDSSFNHELLRSTLKPFHKDIEESLAGYFYQHPIYELKHSTFERSAKNAIKNIVIKEDELLLKFH